jgi:integrase
MARPLSHDISIRHVPEQSPTKPWRVQWKQTINGERKKVSRFFVTEAGAQQLKTEIEQQSGTLPAALPAPRPTKSVAAPAVKTSSGKLTYQGFADKWLEDIISRRKHSTQRSYAGILETHLYPHLGTLEVGDIDVPAITAMLTARRAAGVEWGTQQAILRVLSTSLTWARHTQKIKYNPAFGLAKILKDDSGTYEDPEPNPLTREQADAFLHWLATGTVIGQPNRPVDGPRFSRSKAGRLRSVGYPEWVAYFLFLLRTGMRRGEAAALQWDTLALHVDWPHARIVKSYSPSLAAAAADRAELAKYKSGDGPPKTKKSRRVVDFGPELIATLLDLEHAWRAEDRKLKPYVFRKPRGGRILSDDSTADRVFDLGMAALGLTADGHTMHDLRDTFATCQLMAGSNLLWVSSMLGHENPSTTQTKYARWAPNVTGGRIYEDVITLRERLRLESDGRIPDGHVYAAALDRPGFSYPCMGQQDARLKLLQGKRPK